MRVLELAHSLAVCNGMLNTAALLVPARDRTEWLAEWRSELWHVWQVCNQSDRSGPCHSREEATAFCLGAFKDAYLFRRGQSGSVRRPLLRTGTPSRCILTLALIATAASLFAYCRPAVWNHVRPKIYPAAGELFMISRWGFESTAVPTVQFSEYQTWLRNSRHVFTGLAFYRVAAKHLTIEGSQTAAMPVARASANLFDLLSVPVAFAIPASETKHHPRILLRQSVWSKVFKSDARIFGRMLSMDGEQVIVAGVIRDEDWQLPGRADAWLLEDAQHSSNMPADAEGYVLAHTVPAVFPEEPGRRRQMYAPRKDEGYDYFVCESLAEQIREPLSIFWFALLLALLALPATTSLPLGEYPANSNQVPWTVRVRRWAFLVFKFLLIVSIVYFGALDLAYSGKAMPVSVSEMLELFVSFWGLLFAFRWALRDQRKRCPVCLRTLTNPARVGQFSRNFLAWNGTELVCLSGHGLLHVPDIPTSWFGSQRWLYLDSSWSGLFPIGT